MHDVAWHDREIADVRARLAALPPSHAAEVPGAVAARRAALQARLTWLTQERANAVRHRRARQSARADA